MDNTTLGLAVEGDPADEHIVTLLQNGISERRLVPGNAGRAIAFHRMIADAFELIRGVGSEAGESVNVRAAAQAEANDALVALNEELAAKLADADQAHAAALGQAQEAADATAADLRQQVASLTAELIEARKPATLQLMGTSASVGVASAPDQPLLGTGFIAEAGAAQAAGGTLNATGKIG